MAAARAVVEPVFLLNKLLPLAADDIYSVAEICSAAEKTSGHNTIEGAQRIGGLWRLYPTTIDSRVALLTSGIVLRGHTVQPRDRNPFMIRDDNGQEREVAAVKVIIGGIPMSYDNVDILKVMDKLGVKMRSNLIDERDRVNGKLTRWKTGRRIAFIDPPNKPLPRAVQVGAFRASIYHRGQNQVECARCLDKTHRTAECTSDIRCRVCRELGHASGSPACALAPRAPLPPPPPPPPTEEESNQEEGSAIAASSKQTLLPFQPSHAARTRKSRSATPSNREKGKRERSTSVCPWPPQHVKTARTAGSTNETAHCAQREERGEDADASCGT